MSRAQALSFSNARVWPSLPQLNREEVRALFELPERIHRVASEHRQHFHPTEVQISALLSIKTVGCARRVRNTAPA